MRFLIDGYNLMHAQGLMGKRFGLDGFRKARTRFLNGLAESLGAVDAHLTTVVFDATSPPGDLPRESSHKGIRVVFAVAEDDADERIEALIAGHTAPKLLTVVSSDNRIRLAATRRRAKALSTDDFLAMLDARKRRPFDVPPSKSAESTRDKTLSTTESDYWLNEFRELQETPDVLEDLGRAAGIPTDADIAKIDREVEQEFRQPGNVIPPKPTRRRPKGR